MKKVTLLFVLGAILVSPRVASASIFDDFASWIVPDQLKPQVVVSPTEEGVGGVLITPDPVVLTGDTASTFFLPALGTRSFTIENKGDTDLYLNKSKDLRYGAMPAQEPGDVPGSYILPKISAERTITISNPATSTNYYLSRTDLGIKESAQIYSQANSQKVTVSSQSSAVFVSEAKAQATPVTGTAGEPSIASVVLSFKISNATANDIVISKLIDPLNFVSLTTVPQTNTAVKFITANPAAVTGDASTTYVVPAGQFRTFDVTAIVDNTNGTKGKKTVSITGIRYSNASDGSKLLSINDQNILKKLSVGVELGTGNTIPATVPTKTPEQTKATPTPAATPTNTVTPPTTVTPSPKQTATPSPKTSVSPSPTVTTSGSPSNQQTSVISPAAMVVTFATTTIGSPIIENNQITGYPVTFSFTVLARGKGVFMSKIPSLAFKTTETGFETVLPNINNILANPGIRSGDGGSYYLIPASTTRMFQAFAVLSSDGLTKAGTLTYQITHINYGLTSTNVTSASTTENTQYLKATVKLSPFITTQSTPSPSVSVSPSPSSSASASPSSSSLIALCYAVPSNPVTGDTVTWQVMQSGGSGTPVYTWTGTDSLSGSTASLAKRYSTTGKKDALVSVVVGSQSVTTSCYVNVGAAPVTASPSSTPSPSSSSSASPSGSGVSLHIDPNKSFVANALYSLGEFLDSLVH